MLSRFVIVSDMANGAAPSELDRLMAMQLPAVGSPPIHPPFVPGGLLVNLPGGLLLPGFGNGAHFEIGRGVNAHGTELLSFRLVLDGADPETIPPRPALQAMLNLLAQQVMSQVAQARRSTSRQTNRSVIDALPAVRGAAMADTTCAVCQDTFEGGDAESAAVCLPCDHAFHRCCIGPWLEEHNTCPTCRFELDTNDAEYNERLHADRAESNRALEQKLVDSGAASLSTAELKTLLRLRKIERNSREDKEGLIELLQGGPAALPKKRKRSRTNAEAPQQRDAARKTRSTRSARSTRSSTETAAGARVVDNNNDSDQENSLNPLETSDLFEIDEPELDNSGPTRRSSRSSRGRSRLGAARLADGEGDADLVLRTSPRANNSQSSSVAAAAVPSARPKRARRASTGRRCAGV